MWFDLLKNDGVSVSELTQAISLAPYQSKKLAPLFTFKGVTQRRFDLERRHGIIQLATTKPWGSGETTFINGDTRDLVPFECYHIPVDAKIHASEVNGIRTFGTESETETVEGLKNERIAAIRQTFENCFERMRIGAIKGVVTDADGSSLTGGNLFTKFGIVQTSVNMLLSTPTTDIIAKCEEIRAAMEAVLGDLSFAQIVVVCSPAFFKALVTHAKVLAAYGFDSVSKFLRENQEAKGTFEFGDIRFVRYRTNDLTDNLTSGEAYAYAEGIPGLFMHYGCPPNWVETVNTVGKAQYLKQTVKDDGHDEYVQMLGEANPCMICTRPESLILINQNS